METVAGIGSSIRIKGEVHSGEPLIIAGHVDGTVEVVGHPLTIDAGGSVEATVSAQTIVISGRATGILTAAAKVIIKSTATIDADIAAPKISLADGATVNGRMETEKNRPALPLAS